MASPLSIAVPTAEASAGYGTVSDGNQKQPDTRTEHLGKHRQYWRDIILGVNDGLVSTFLLVAGVAGSGLSSTDILLTAIAGALAGAVSMAAGEFTATKSQNEVLKGTIHFGMTRSAATKFVALSRSESRTRYTLSIPIALANACLFRRRN